MPLTNVLKKRLMEGESTRSGSSRWAALGLILSMAACTSSTSADIIIGNKDPGASWSKVPGWSSQSITSAYKGQALVTSNKTARTKFTFVSLTSGNYDVYTTPPPPPPGQPVVGLNVQQHTGTFDAAGQAFTKELGAHSIRIAYNHGDHNFGVDWAAQNGVGALFMLGYGAGCRPTTASGRQCYADRSASLAQTYGSKVQYYEVWNEWNGGIGLGCQYGQAGTPCVDTAMYTDLLCRTYTAVKAVQPNATIVGGVTAGVDTNFIRKMLDNGAGNCMDMVSVHPYIFGTVGYNAPPSVAVDKFIERITAVENLIEQKTGRTIPILVTEDGRSDRGQSSNQQRTADYITELYNRAGSVPFLDGIWWFALEDSVDGKWGLLRSNNTKKPSFAAYQAAAGSDPIAITKASFKAGSNAINAAVLSIPRIIRASVANINITEAAY